MLTGEVLSKIQISGSHTIDVVCHAFWNLLEAIFLANIPLIKQSLAHGTLDEDLPTYFAHPLPHRLVLSTHDKEVHDVESPTT